MTCRPDNAVIINDLEILAASEVTEQSVSNAHSLLVSISSVQLTDVERTKIFVPTECMKFFPLEKTYFNDLGDRSCLVELDQNHALCHPLIDRNLAGRLRMIFLGVSDIQPLDQDQEEIGEKFTTKIRNTLLKYTIAQTFGEFLSNAVDAGAMSFGILVDELNDSGCSKTLSPAMRDLQNTGALVFFNDAIFQEKDFKGIHNVGDGGKLDSKTSIGQFGLGALSMYHFTEVTKIQAFGQ